jgi:glutathione S-transferase
MQLIGMLDSPYVRRVAISAKLLGLPLEHRALSVFRNFEEFGILNPIVKAPTFFADDGTMLIDSSLILDYLDQLVAPDLRLMPENLSARTRALQLNGLSLAAMEKTVQVVYEHGLRPADKLHRPWLDRVLGQLGQAYRLLEMQVAAAGGRDWLLGERITQADVTAAVAWRFTTFMTAECKDLGVIAAELHPALTALCARAESLPEFVSTPLT